MSKILILFFAAILSSHYCIAQSNPQLVKYIDTIFKELNNKEARGCAITIIENGKQIARKAYGMANFEHQIPFTHKSAVKMGYSEGREFLSIAAALMEQDGILKLEDKVRKYFPGLPAWAEPVTIWDLLNHSSGFVDEWAEFSLMHSSVANRIDESQFLNLLYNQPKASVEPGTGYMYSNSDYGLLRLVLEKASGKNLSEWMKQRIFDPLKMHATLMQNDPEEFIPNKATMYWEATDKTSPGSNYFIVTNAEDIEKWYAAHTNPNSEIAMASAKLLSKSRMLPVGQQYPIGYSIKKIQGQKVIFHQGIHDESFLTRVPGKNFAIIAVGKVRDRHKMILEKYLKVPAAAPLKFMSKLVSVTETDLKKYEGRYLWIDDKFYDSYVKGRQFSDFFVSDSELHLAFNSNFTSDIVPVAKNKFYLSAEGMDVQIDFIDAKQKEPMKVTIIMADGYKVDMIKDTSRIWKPSKTELESFTGKYYSKHLDYYWTLSVNEDGKLIIKRPTIADIEVEPDGTNQFKFKIDYYAGNGYDGWILFHKDANDNITHFTVWHSRLMHHRFDKLKL